MKLKDAYKDVGLRFKVMRPTLSGGEILSRIEILGKVSELTN